MQQPRIVINAIGGLANRLRAIGWAAHTASLTGREPEIVWAVNDDLHAAFTDLFRPVGIPVVTPRRLDYLIRWQQPRKKNLYLSALWQRARFGKVYTDVSGLPPFFDRPDDFVKTVASAPGDILVISGLTLDEAASARFYTRLRPAAPVQRLIDMRTSRFTPHTVGVHIRRTDNKLSISHSPLQLFENEMERLITVNPEVNFFVCSDDPAVMARLSERFPRRVMCGDTDARRNTLEGMRRATADMFALARTSLILGSYWSSFSQTAALIGNIPLKVIKTGE